MRSETSDKAGIFIMLFFISMIIFNGILILKLTTNSNLIIVINVIFTVLSINIIFFFAYSIYSKSKEVENEK